jgi:hypothetical protein
MGGPHGASYISPNINPTHNPMFGINYSNI